MSRSAEQNQRMRDDRREKILQHALKLFSSKGLRSTRTADIAAAAQMSQGLLYHYFRSKEDIFTELIRDAFEKMNAAAEELENLEAPAKDKVVLALTKLTEGIRDSEDFAGTVMLIAQAGVSTDTPAEARRILDEKSGIPYASMERIMRAGQQEGTIKDFSARQLALVFMTAIKGFALHRAVYGSEVTAPDVRILAGMFLCEPPANCGQGE